MKVYLAARYGRRQEILANAKDLERRGHVVTSRWITGIHEIPGRRESDGYSVEERRRFAEEDLRDLREADVLVAFTEAVDAKASRGGRHVEYGAALERGLLVYVVGPRENVFHCLGHVEQSDDWVSFLRDHVAGWCPEGIPCYPELSDPSRPSYVRGFPSPLGPSGPQVAREA